METNLTQKRRVVRQDHSDSIPQTSVSTPISDNTHPTHPQAAPPRQKQVQKRTVAGNTSPSICLVPPNPTRPSPCQSHNFLIHFPLQKKNEKRNEKRKKEIFISFASLSRRTIPETICVHLPYFSNMGIPRGGRNVGRRLRPFSGSGARRVRQSSLLGQKSTLGSFRGEKDPHPRRALLVPHLPPTKPNLVLFVSALLLLL